MTVKVSAFLEAFGDWVRSQPEVVAVVLVGSYARGAATESSDVDLVILTSDVDKYLRDRSWLSLFGNVTGCREEDYGRVTSLRVFYSDRMEVEYGFSTPDWADLPLDAGTLKVITDGMKVLYDPQRIIGTMLGNADV